MCCTGNTQGRKEQINWYCYTWTDWKKKQLKKATEKIGKVLSDKHTVCGGIAYKFVERNDKHCDGTGGGTQIVAGTFIIQRALSFTLFVKKM